MDDHADEAVLSVLRIGAVLLRTRALPAKHRVLHATNGGIHGDGDGVRIIKRVARKHLHRVRHRVRAVSAPERLAFLRPIAHAHDCFSVEIHAHCVPQKLARAAPREIPHVVRLVNPRLFALRLFLFVGFGFIERDDKHRLLRITRFGEAIALHLGQHSLGILQLASGRHNMIGRGGDADSVIAKLQRKLARAKVLLVLPAGHVRVGAHAREPLRQRVEMIFVLLKIFVPHPRANLGGIDDVEIPVDRKRDFAAGLQRFGRNDAHHRLHDHMLERFASGILYGSDFVAAIKLLCLQHSLKLVERLIAQPGSGARLMRHQLGVKQVLIQLHPKILERVLGIIVISDFLAADDAVLRLVQFHIDHVISLLLPIPRPGSTRSPALVVGRGQQVVQLFKRILRRGSSGGKQQHGHQGRAPEIEGAFQHRNGPDVPEPSQKSNAEAR